jgi:hypothetical protein
VSGPVPSAPRGETVSPKRPRRVAAWILVTTVVTFLLVLLAIAIADLALTPAASTHAKPTGAALYFAPSQDPCFPSGYQPLTSPTVTRAGDYAYFANLTEQAGNSARYCTVASIWVNTPEFSIAGSDLPLNLSSSPTGELELVLAPHPITYVGPIYLTANVTFLLPDVNVTGQGVAYTPSSLRLPCGVASGLSAAGFPFEEFSGTDFSDELRVYSMDPTSSCEVTQVGASTPGFTIVNASVPVALKMFQDVDLNVTLGVPPAAYSGNLDLLLTIVET